ncbi:flagellar basal-body MS-ring/collar protein FliF [Pelagibacterium lacus]|uniref:Flagellar M-ring protein n=1 Tax=Pelagibacterium lacus TaxID=2282655 RepID=A0A369W4H7_9HYPH|nr:flagellar basal-body MS-ring/collar protein FliF [Pelagibacterium lacus]RDE08240.1 flagellar M-ring protein FliF [Pelagibacterium lacus]
MNQLGELLGKLGVARIAAMGAVALMMIGFFAFLIVRSSTPQLAPLYTNLEFDDSAAIIAELNATGTPYELRNEGATILVPRDRITTVRMALAQDGLPARGQVGYEIFDSQNTLGATSFIQNINHVRALEGELARTIGALSRVQSARVHLVLPERELFRREVQKPSASIVLTVRGQLASGEIRAIQHLVASAIEGLSPNAVSIVDSAGTLLASGAGEDDTSIAAQALEERTVGIENRLRSQIEELLASVVGLGRARVQVAAELDLNRSTITSQTFDPDGQVVRSAQTVETGDQSSGPGNSGQVTVANELPGASQGGAAGTGTQTTSSTLEETFNYEISNISETLISEAGAIKRLSVAVIVDGVYTYDADGNAVYEPRSQTQIDQITALVRTAMGYDANRGDQLEVANLQFAERPGLAAGTQAPGPLDFNRDDLMRFAEMAVTLLIALALVLFVMRPLLKKALAPEAKPLALPAAASVPADYAGEDAPDPAAMLAARDATEAWLSQARSLGESQVKTLRMVGDLVEENPKQASLVIRDWLSEAA